MVKFDPRQLAEWSAGVWKNDIPQAVHGVSIDSRTITPGNIFIAIRGPNFDGHDFVASAVKQGACGVIISRRDLIKQYACPLLLVDDTTKALQQIAAHYRRTINTKVIAVTGSVGKTTVKEMIANVLASRLPTARTIGNWNNEYGLPLSILSMAPQSKIGVFELGVSHPGEMAPLCRLLQPDWAVVTLVGPVHLEFFGSEKKVAEEKAILLRHLPEDGLAFVGHNGHWYEFLHSAVKCRLISVGIHARADYVLKQVLSAGNIARVLEKKTGDFFEYKLPLPGAHMAYNSLFAVAAARAYGFDWPVIRNALEKFQTQPMRWESTTISGIFVINDAYNANPVSMEAALRTFAELSLNGRKWLVLGGMRELGSTTEHAHKELGGALAQFNWAGLIVVGRLGQIIADAALAGGMDKQNIFKCEDHQSAAKKMAALLRSGDAVLFKASRGERLEKVLEIWEQMQKGKNG